MVKALADTSVLVLTGARQVGKSTLLLHEAPFNHMPYFSLDNFDTLRQADEDPFSLWAGYTDIVIDEVQKAPRLLSAIKQAVDKDPGKYHFVLSGSANLLLMKQVSESLAGRAIYFELDPLTVGEILETPAPTLITDLMAGHWLEDTTFGGSILDLPTLLLRGLLPPLVRLDSAPSWTRWWEGYVATYLERDLRQVSQISSLLDYRRMMELLALRCGQVLNQSELGRDAGLTQPTTHRYLNLLETTCLFHQVPAFSGNPALRLVKSPKAFWNDTGLVSYLSGYYQKEDLQGSRQMGHIFENFIYHHLNVTAQMMIPRGRIYHFRTTSGKEVDFILEHGRRHLAFEVKLTAKPGYHDTENLRAYLDQHPQAAGGILIHCGDEIRRIRQNILAVPWRLISG